MRPGLGERILKEGGTGDDEHSLTASGSARREPPNAREREVLSRLLVKQQGKGDESLARGRRWAACC